MAVKGPLRDILVRGAGCDKLVCGHIVDHKPFNTRRARCEMCGDAVEAAKPKTYVWVLSHSFAEAHTTGGESLIGIFTNKESGIKRAEKEYPTYVRCDDTDENSVDWEPGPTVETYGDYYSLGLVRVEVEQ